MRTRAILLSTLLFALGTASGAKADVVLIDFDFSQSSVSILGGVITIPPQGSINSASGTLTFVAAPGATTGNPIVTDGFARLSALTLDGTISATVGGLVSVTGTLMGNQVGAANGLLTPGLANAVFNAMVLSLDAFVNCTPPATCGFLGTFPISIMGPQSLTGLGTLPIGNINVVGSATVSATLTITLAGNQAQLMLVGEEVSRQLVPEPNTAALVGLGMLSLAGYGNWRRRRQR